MPKITAGDTKGLLIKYSLKLILSSAFCILGFGTVCSFIILKLDLELEHMPIITTIVCIISAFIISFISTGGFKNNFLMLSLISVMPLTIFTIVNFCFNKTGTVFILVKVFAIIGTAFITSLIKSAKRSR